MKTLSILCLLAVLPVLRAQSEKRPVAANPAGGPAARRDQLTSTQETDLRARREALMLEIIAARNQARMATAEKGAPSAPPPARTTAAAAEAEKLRQIAPIEQQLLEHGRPVTKPAPTDSRNPAKGNPP